jgi:hypothetical protein
MGGGYIDPFILDLGTSQRWVVNFTPRLLYSLWKEHQSAWAPKSVCTAWKQKNILPLPGLELRPLGHPAHSPSLYWLRYPGSLLKLYEFQNWIGFRITLISLNIVWVRVIQCSQDDFLVSAFHNILSRVCVSIDGGLDWILNLLTTYRS